MDDKVIVASYIKPHQAELAATKLRDSNIPVDILDDKTVSADPILGNAVGGVKLQVAEEDADRAQELLADERDGSLDDELSGEDLDEEFEELDEEESEEWDEMTKGLHCPECGSKSVSISSPILHGYIALTLFVFFSPFWLPPGLTNYAFAALVLLAFVGTWAFILRKFPLHCKECGHSGKRPDFDPTVD